MGGVSEAGRGRNGTSVECPGDPGPLYWYFDWGGSGVLMVLKGILMISMDLDAFEGDLRLQASPRI